MKAFNLLSTLTLLLILTAAGAAHADPVFMFRGGAGAKYMEDDGFDVIQANPTRASGGAGFDLRILGPLWISADFEGSLTRGETFTRESSYDTLGMGLGATWRWAFAQRLALFGRASAMARRVSVEIGDVDGNAWTFGGRAGGGLEFTALDSRYANLGLRLEVTYERCAPVDVRAGNTSLGTFDPSGPSALLGFFVAL